MVGVKGRDNFLSVKEWLAGTLYSVVGRIGLLAEAGSNIDEDAVGL